MEEMNMTAIVPTADSLRQSLQSYLVAQFGEDETTVFIHEMGLRRGSARIDLAAINGKLHGYEIKSSRDDLRRLANQVGEYNRVFDRVTLVCSKAHVHHALNVVPSWWEVLCIEMTESGPTFEIIRKGKENPGVDPRALVELLWLDEAEVILANHQALRGLRGKSRAAHWDRICELLKIEEISEAVRSHIKATATKRGRQR